MIDLILTSGCITLKSTYIFIYQLFKLKFTTEDVEDRIIEIALFENSGQEEIDFLREKGNFIIHFIQLAK